MESALQSIGISDYYFHQPCKFPLSGFILNVSHFNPIDCPFYAPVCKDGRCRLCYKGSYNHRKYYLYSNYARIIQKIYFKYIFLKRNKGKYVLFNKYNINYILLHKILEYKTINYRKMNIK